MELEIARNMKNLHLDGMKDPFYIGLNIVDINRLSVHSSLGALIKYSEAPLRITYNTQVLVGEFKKNNLNFMDPKSAGYYFTTSRPLPIDNSVPVIQRALWQIFDRAYKLSAETYESKLSYLKSNAQYEDVVTVPDFTASEKVAVDQPEIPIKYNSDVLTKYANDISQAFRPYIYLSNSWVRIVGHKANVYYANSDGSKATYPTSVLRLVVDAEIQDSSGEIVELYQMYHALNEADLPSKDQVIQDIKKLSGALYELITVPKFDDVYMGPVLFEDKAASEAVRKTMFYARNENLFSAKRPINNGPGMNQQQQNRISTDDRIDKKIAADGLNVKAVSTLTELGGQKLIGSYPIDMEGVIPGKETILIENGVLKNLLSGRAPTAKVKVSNGHQRVPLNMPTPMIVPGVIDVSFTNGTSKEELRKKLIELAKAEGLSYALIVREMTPNLSELKKVYKVDVNTGKEYLIRSASFNGLTLNDLRKIVGAGDQKIVLNTTAGEDLQHKLDFMTGCPATFITPDAFLFRDIEINKLSKPVMAKVPIVPNPLSL
jgi:hypothetical protein